MCRRGSNSRMESQEYTVLVPLHWETDRNSAEVTQTKQNYSASRYLAPLELLQGKDTGSWTLAH